MTPVSTVLSSVAPCLLELLISPGTVFFSHNETTSADLSAAETINRTGLSLSPSKSNTCKYWTNHESTMCATFFDIFLDVSSPVSLYKVKGSFSLLKKSAIFNFE
jgi:hypothetical protein